MADPDPPRDNEEDDGPSPPPDRDKAAVKSKDEKPSILVRRYCVAKLSTRVVVRTLSRSDDADCMRVPLAARTWPRVSVLVRTWGSVWGRVAAATVRLLWRWPGLDLAAVMVAGGADGGG